MIQSHPANAIRCIIRFINSHTVYYCQGSKKHILEINRKQRIETQIRAILQINENTTGGIRYSLRHIIRHHNGIMEL